MSGTDTDILRVAAAAATEFLRAMEVFAAALRAAGAQMPGVLGSFARVATPARPVFSSPARDELIRQRYGAEGGSAALLAALNALPGLPLTKPRQIWARAEVLGVRRESAAEFRPQNALYTKARGELMAARYPAEGASPTLVADLNALAGRAFESRGMVASFAKSLGLARAEGWRNAPRAKRRRPTAEAESTGATPAQIDMLRRDYPAGVASLALIEAAGALGPAMNAADIAHACLLLKLARPPGFDPCAANAAWQADRATPAEPAVTQIATTDTSELSPAGWCTVQIEATAEPIAPPLVEDRPAADDPVATVPAVPVAIAAAPRPALPQPAPPHPAVPQPPLPRPALPRPAHTAEKPVRLPAARRAVPVSTDPHKQDPSLPPPGIAAPPAFTPGETRGAAPIPTPAQIQREAEARLVAAHIATKGVTHCPAAACEASTTTLSAEDRAAVHAYAEAQREAYETKSKAHRARITENRLRRLNGKAPIAAVHA